MTVGYALAIKRLYGPGIVRVAAKHNLREIAAELGADGHIDAARIADNFTLRGPNTAEGVAQLAKSLMDAAGVVKCRKTAVMALELLFTLPAGTTVNPRQYFEQAISWAERHFGVPVLSCIAHLDEGAPHAHALLLPLVDGRMGGSDLHGGKAKLWVMQTSFHDEVGSRFGLVRQAAQKRLSAPVRAAAIQLARDCLQANSALTDAIVDALLLPHVKDPESLLSALGIDMPVPKAKAKPSFAAMMTAPCKPEPRNPIGKANRNPIGIESAGTAPESQPYTCVGIGFPTAPIPHDFHHRHASTGTFASHLVTEGKQGEASLPEAGAQRNEVQRSTTAGESSTMSGTPGDQRQPADIRLEALEASTLSTVGPTRNTGIAPTKRAAAAAKRQLASIRPTPCAHDVSNSQHISPVPTVKVVRQLGEQQPVAAGRDVSKFGRIPNGGAGIAPPEARLVPDADGDYHRHRDDDNPADQWDCDRGEFVTMPTQEKTIRGSWPLAQTALPEARASPAAHAPTHLPLAPASNNTYPEAPGAKWDFPTSKFQRKAAP